MSVNETRLPHDLEREIFEYTADLYPEAIPSLLCIAHRVLAWIEPIAYHTINVDFSRRFLLFLATTKSKPPEFFATHVRRIIVRRRNSFDGPFEDACAALALCTNITQIAGVGPLCSELLLPIIAPMRLKRIAVFLTHMFPSIHAVDLSLPCFQTLTHFDVFDYMRADRVALAYAAKLCALPVLTHLSLNGTVPWSAVEMLLQGCRCLQVLVVLWGGSEKKGRARAAQAPFDDVRFVVTRYDIYKEAIRDPPNYWTQARAFIADKRLGKIDTRCFWMARD
ncbi:hypothetical protein C8F01DRAFT_1366573 [Mycena amicta]|nr:hypothetical protein C8F01DRAFT_1366573 [Mycena amicta]